MICAASHRQQLVQECGGWSDLIRASRAAIPMISGGHASARDRAGARGEPTIVCDEPVSASMSRSARNPDLLRELQDRLGRALSSSRMTLAVVTHMPDRVAV